MRIAPGVITNNNEWLVQPVETNFVQKPANIPLFVGQLDTIPVEEVTKDKSETITPPATVPVTTLDKAEALEDAMQNTVATDTAPTLEDATGPISESMTEQVAGVSSSVDYGSANPYGTITRPRGSLFNSRIAPPSIVPTTYPFGPSNSDSTGNEMESFTIQQKENNKKQNKAMKKRAKAFEKLQKKKSKEGYRDSRQVLPPSSPLNKFYWGLCGGEKTESEKNEVEKFCTRNWGGVRKAILALIIVTAVLIFFNIVMGITIRVQKRNGELVYGKGKRFNGGLGYTPKSYPTSFASRSNLDNTTGISAADITTAAGSAGGESYNIF